MRPWLPELVALLLFLSALRIGPREAVGSIRDSGNALRITLIYQLAFPLFVAVVLLASGVVSHPMALALAMIAAGSSISGAPHFALMLGGAPAPALRVLILGTALLPLTVIPIFWLIPGFGDARAVAEAALRLCLVIGFCVCAAFSLRQFLLRSPDLKTTGAIDGASVLTLAIIVIGLMSAVGPALLETPLEVATWLAFVLVVNFGLQAIAFFALKRTTAAIPFSIIAGNRNIALFLVALPPDVTGPLLLFIGCYQIPMYLTPIAMRPLYAAARTG